MEIDTKEIEIERGMTAKIERTLTCAVGGPVKAHRAVVGRGRKRTQNNKEGGPYYPPCHSATINRHF